MRTLAKQYIWLPWSRVITWKKLRPWDFKTRPNCQTTGRVLRSTFHQVIKIKLAESLCGHPPNVSAPCLYFLCLLPSSGFNLLQKSKTKHNHTYSAIKAFSLNSSLWPPWRWSAEHIQMCLPLQGLQNLLFQRNPSKTGEPDTSFYIIPCNPELPAIRDSEFCKGPP